MKQKQIIYPKYAGFIVLYASIFLIIGINAANVLEKIFPKFDETKKKSTFIIYIEVLLQISSIAIITYIFREVTSNLIESVPMFKKHMYGSPDKFAALVIAPTMFSVQPSLISKIEYLANY